MKLCRIHGFNLQSARCLFPSFRVRRRGGQSVVGEGVVFSDQLVQGVKRVCHYLLIPMILFVIMRQDLFLGESWWLVLIL